MEVASGEYGEDKVQVLVQSVKTGNCDKMIASMSGESTPRNSHSGSSENDVPLDTISEDTGLLRGNEAADLSLNGHVNGFIVGENAEDSFNAGEIKVGILFAITRNRI